MKSASVIVVGAGFAGLAAACELQEAGVEVRVLEARERVGGRVEAGINGLGESMDFGGQFFCDDMPEVMALARRYGKTLVEPVFAGEPVMLPGLPDRTRGQHIYADAIAVRQRLRRSKPDDPAFAGLTVAVWAEKQPIEPAVRQMFLAMIEGLWCLPVSEIPLWYLISNDRRITNTVSELQYFSRQTLNSLAADLAAELGPRVVLDEPVTHIAMANNEVGVRARSLNCSARRVIVALPPAMARRIGFEPSLPSRFEAALAAWRSGMVVKAFLRYRRPFWRDAGLSGTVLSLEPRGFYVCDISPDDGAATLVAFISGAIARDWLADGATGLRHAVLSRLETALGPAAAGVLDFSWRDWSSDPWSGGGYSDVVTAMDATDAEEVLRAGLPSVRFAASELSPSFPGYVEGAIVSGRQQARAVLAELSSAGRGGGDEILR